MRGKNVFKLARATMTLLFAMLTNFGAWAESDNVASLSEDNDFAQGTEGHYYVNMPKTGRSVLTLSNANITTFNVYDDGGKSDSHSSSCDGYLVINAPSGYYIKVTGKVDTETGCDWLKFYDGDTNNILGRDQYTGSDKVGELLSSGNCLKIRFRSDSSREYGGMSLTVYLIAPTDICFFPGLEEHYIYTGNVINLNYKVLSADHTELTKDVDYSVTVTPSPVKEVGRYSITVNGKGQYTGTLTKEFVVEKLLAGSGTKNDPYMINSDEDWSTFAYLLENNYSTYADKYYRLGADINVSEAACLSEEKPFRGTFDGDGHTMTLNLEATENYCAPFRYANGCNFKRLHVSGTITTNGYRYAGGLIAYADGYYSNTYIDNCWSSVRFVSTAAADNSYHNRCYGGFIGYVYSNAYIKNCLYDGSLIGPEVKGCSGFVADFSTYSHDLRITNCLFAPAQITIGDYISYTFAKEADLIDNCYYTQSFGTVQGSPVGSMTNAELKEALGSMWQIKNDRVVPIQENRNLDYSTLICKSSYEWTGSEISVVPIVKDLDGNTIDPENYEITFSPSPVLTLGNYTMTITGKAANGYSGSLTQEIKVLAQLPGSGQKNDPYIISSSDDWNRFAEMVNGGYNYSGRFVALDRDITISTMVGLDASHCFEGYFDGRDHTLTVNLQNNDPAVEGVAPFHHTRFAKIMNLTVDGTITSAGKYAAGLIGWSGSPDECTNCVVKATITTSADYAGGFVGNIDVESENSHSISFNNCVFAGTIQSSNSEQHKAGGFCGYGYGNSYLTNCLENGTYTNISMMNPRTGYKNPSNKQVNSLYYINKIGSIGEYITENYNCFNVSLTAPENAFYLTRAIQGYTFYQPVSVSAFMDSYLYDGDAINLVYTLKAGVTTLTENTDYTVTIKNSNNETVAMEDLTAAGIYTITFTPVDGNEAGYAGQSISRTFNIIQDAETLDGYVFSYEGEGDNKVYHIDNEADLERLAAYVNSGHNAQGMTFVLTTDITMTGEHTAIGKDYDNPFNGTFDGRGNKIIGLTINKPDCAYQGLFGRWGGHAVARNIILQDCDITGYSNVGGILGYVSEYNSNVLIENCHVSGTIKGILDDGFRIGGIAGYLGYGNIKRCTVRGSLSSTANVSRIGGIIGETYYGVKVDSCENAADITGPGALHAGIFGLAAQNDLVATNCLNTGIVEGTELIGGISGYYRDQSKNYGNYTHCYYVAQGDGSAYKASIEADKPGKTERIYEVLKEENFSDITCATDGVVVTSMIDGKKYIRSGNWTVTLTPSVPEGYTFVNYTCQGGTLTNLGQVDGEHSLTVNNQNITLGITTSKNGSTNINLATISDIADQRWSGNIEIKPSIVATYNDVTLVEGTDYYLEYSNNIDKGTATAILKGLNNFEGTATKEFNIVDFPLQDSQKSNRKDNPYLIATEADLKALAGIVNSGKRLDGYYKQTAPITLTTEHTPIGTDINHWFRGSYNGDNNVISNLVINKPNSENQGLFGAFYGGWQNSYYGEITNVVLENCDITGGKCTGGIVGIMYDYGGRVTNCKVSGVIRVGNDLSDDSNANRHGGIVGECCKYWCGGGTVENCINIADVTGEGKFHGGIVGYISDNFDVSNCFNAGVIEGTSYVGSIMGGYTGRTLTNNYHTAGTTGGAGSEDNSEGTDRKNAEVIVKITAGEGVTITYPENPAYIWNGENYYKSGTDVTLAYELPDGKYFERYAVSSGNISNPAYIQGSHTLTDFSQDVIISGKCVDGQTDIATATVMSIDDLTYNGKEQHPLPVVTIDNETLVENVNYTISYDTDCTNVGEKTVTITGIGRFNGTTSQVFNIKPFDIGGENALTISNVEGGYAQTEDVQHPVPTAKCSSTNNATLSEGTDYLLSYSEGCILPGDYTITLTGKGNYTGQKLIPFTILNAKALTVHDKSSSNEYVPVYGYYADNFNKCEFVMPADELAAMNGKVISNMKFYLQQKAEASWGKARFRVFMKEVDFTAFGGSPVFSGTDDATIVYEGELDGTKDVMNIPFSTPYLYKGGNLLIGCYEYQTGSYIRAYFYGENVNYASIQGYNSNFDQINANHRNFLPKTTFWYEDNKVVLADNDSELADDEKNIAKIEANNGIVSDVTLSGRTLYKDGEWNTICLPFNVTLAESPLAGADVRALDNADLTDGVLTLNFTAEAAIDELVAGTPYIIKWANNGEENIVDPVFTDVTIDNTDRSFTCTDFEFKGTYSYQSFDNTDKSIIFLGTGNKLYYPLDGARIGAFRAYFDLNAPSYSVKSFKLAFGEDDATSINGELRVKSEESVYDLSGRKVNVPSAKVNTLRKGTYIVNGKKVLY